MMQLVEANWPVLLAAFLIGLLVAWLIYRSTRRTRITRDADAPADGAPAKRNQALIDAPPVSAGTADTRSAAEAETLTEAANTRDVAAASAEASEEAGATPPAREAIRKMDAAREEADQPAASTTSDDLTRIKGVGPKLVALLADEGVTSFSQIAAWDDAEIDRMDARLGRFQGRIRRDDWPKQARLLAAGDTQGYEAQFGRL